MARRRDRPGRRRARRRLLGGDARDARRRRPCWSTRSWPRTASRAATSPTTPRWTAAPATILRRGPDGSGWQLTVYDPAFTTPDWTRGAVVYQVFPDRFANGDPTNDPSPDATPGPTGADRFRYGDVYGNPILVKAWTDLPGGLLPRLPGRSPATSRRWAVTSSAATSRASRRTSTTCATGASPALYLNPIFAAPSNHRYDTSDYLTIDPDLGTAGGLRRARRRGPRAGHQGDPRRRVQPRLVRFAVVRPAGPLRGGRAPASRPTRRIDRGSRSGRRDPASRRRARRRRPVATTPTTSAGRASTPSPRSMETPEVVELITGADGVVRHWLRAGHRWLAPGRGGRPQPGADAAPSGPRPRPRTPTPRHRGAVGRLLGVAAR